VVTRLSHVLQFNALTINVFGFRLFFNQLIKSLC